MATLRPAARMISRRFLTPTTITTTSFLRTTPIQTLKLTQPTPRYKTDASSIPARDRAVPVPGPSTSSDISTADSGAYPQSPGSPDPNSHLESGVSKSTIYNFEDIRSISESPSSSKILIDVREQSEVLGTGKIPGAVNVPISSSPDGFFLSAEDFEDRYGFEKPGEDVEVVFYCKAGVRSKAAARLAGQAGFGGKVGEFPGSWAEWVAKGGKIEQMQ